MGFGSGAWSLEFAQRLGRKGWTRLTWPQRYGGQARPLTYKLVLLEEMAYHHAPFASYSMADAIAGMLLDVGSETLRQEMLPAIGDGETSFWFGFSEPEAGSDLLALTTRAYEDGDDFVVDGQKTFSSNAHLAQYGHVLVRTASGTHRRHGISALIIPNNLSGVSVQPLRTADGDVYNNQVFFTGVRVPRRYLVGERDQAFGQLLAGLEHDRFWARFVKPPWCKRLLEDLIDYLRHKGPLDNVVRAQLAEIAIGLEVSRLLLSRAAWLVVNGLPITYESSAGKVFADEAGQRLAQVGMKALGLYGQAQRDTRWAPLGGKMTRFYLTSVGHTIAGGTSEIIRNTLATRGLGLPQ